MVLKPNVGILGFPDPLIVYLVMGCWVCNFQKRTSFCTEKIYRQKLKKLDNNVAICLIVKLCCNGRSSPPKMTCHPTWWEISESSSITRFCSFTKLTSGSLLPFLHCSSSLNAWLKMKLSTATFSLSLNSSSWEDLGSCHIFPMFVIELNTIGDCLMSRWLPLLRSSNMLSRRFWSFCRWSMPIIVVKKIFWKWRGRRGRREASNSSNSLVVVCSSLSIQNSIWRVSGLFKLNFWSVSCPNSSRQQQTLFVLQEFKWEKIWTAAQQPYYKFSPLFRSCDLSYLAVVDIKRESSSSWYFSTHAISFHKCFFSKEHWGLDNSS